MSVTAYIDFYAKTDKKSWFKISEATSNIVRDIINWKEPECSERPSDFNLDLSYKYNEFCFHICKDDYKEEFGTIIEKDVYGCKRNCIIVNDDKLLEELREIKAPDGLILPKDVFHFICVLKERTEKHQGCFYRVENFEALLPEIKKFLNEEKESLVELNKIKNSTEYFKLKNSVKDDILQDIGNTQSSIDEWKREKNNIKWIINVFNYFRCWALTDNGWIDDVIAYIYIE